MTFGFDISTYQDSPLVAGNVDFVKMRNYGASFVIIRAGQGNWKDDDFDRSWDNAKGVLPRASYWFYDNRYPPKVQARKYFEIISRDPEGFCWLDLEHTVEGSYGRWEDWYDFLAEFHSLCKYPVGIYTGYWYFTDHMKFATSFQKQFFAKYPLWLASYPADPFHVDHSQIRIPYPWTRYVMLQSGTPAIGLAAGVESEEIDYNIWMKDTEFATFWGASVPPAEDPTEEEIMAEYKVRSDQYNMTLRPDHNTGAVGSESVPAGTEMLADAIWTATADLYKVINGVNTKVNVVGDRWAHVVRVGTATKDSWVAITHLGKVYCNSVVEIAPPAEPEFPARVGLTLDGTTIRWYVAE